MADKTGILALDFAFLPGGGIAEEAVRLNRLLRAGYPDDQIVLGPEGSLPHITVAMVCTPEADLPSLQAGLLDMVMHFCPLNVSISGISTVRSALGRRVSGFDVEETEALQAFHESIMDLISPYDAPAPEKGMLLLDPGEAASEATLDYIGSFRSRSAYAHYTPHITLGYGEIGNAASRLSFPQELTVKAIAVCRLGEHCTCREVIGVIGD